MILLPIIPPVIETEQLVLRPLSADDATDLMSVYGDERVMKFASDPAFSDISVVHQMLDSANRLLKLGSSIEWGLCLKVSNQLVGTCGLHSFESSSKVVSAEVGCLLKFELWGCGVMQEALLALFDHAKVDLRILRLIADINRDNLRSRAFFAKLGFTQTADTYFEKNLS